MSAKVFLVSERDVHSVVLFLLEEIFLFLLGEMFWVRLFFWE